MDLRELPDRSFARHPWEAVRAAFFLGVLRDHLSGGAVAALDLGAGDGYFARRLRAEVPAVAQVTCVDTAYDPAWIAAHGEPGLAYATAPPPDRFALVLLLDVLEHAADDVGLLVRAVALTAPGGSLLVSAPAHPSLFSRHDELLGHRRRYPRDGLRRLAEQAGLRVLRQGQLFASLLVPRAFAKAAESLRPRPAATTAHVETALGTWHHGRMLTRAVSGLLAADAAAGRLASRRGWPWPGLSTWLLARRS